MIKVFKIIDQMCGDFNRIMAGFIIFVLIMTVVVGAIYIFGYWLWCLIPIIFLYLWVESASERVRNYD